VTAVRLEVFPSPELFDRVSAVVANAIRHTITEKGSCAVALSGGSTPVPMFERLAAEDLEWPAVHVFQVDERVAPPGHQDRNLMLIERHLRDRVDGEGPHVYPMEVETHQLNDAAARYESALEKMCGRPPVVDVVHLGLGPDGHIASLVPDDPVLDERDCWVSVTRSYRGYVRMTLTYPVLENARLVVFLVTGADKADALASMLAGDRAVPAGRLDATNVVVFADPAASAGR